MKKLLPFVLLMALLFGNQLYAQDTSFGFRAGPSFTTLGGEEGGDGSTFRVGYHFGAYANIGIAETVSFEPGIQFASKGAGSGDDLGADFSLAIRNGYLDIPLLIKFQVADQFFLFVGPQPSFLLTSAFDIRDGNNTVTISGSEAKDLWKTFDFAGVLGLGTNFGEGFNVQLSYEHGFANVSEFSDTVFNRGFKLSLGKSF